MLTDSPTTMPPELTRWETHGVKHTVWRRIRRRILARDGSRCRLCTRIEGAGGLPLQIHHLNFITTDTCDDNLRTLCARCHARLGRIHRHYPWITPDQAWRICRPFAEAHALSWRTAYEFIQYMQAIAHARVDEEIEGFVEDMEILFDGLDYDECTEPD